MGIMSVHGYLDPKTALGLSRLEEDYQTQFYERVEGAHDLDEASLLTHLYCARLLFQNAS